MPTLRLGKEPNQKKADKRFGRVLRNALYQKCWDPSKKCMKSVHCSECALYSGMGWRAIFQIQEETLMEGSSPGGGFAPHQ